MFPEIIAFFLAIIISMLSILPGFHINLLSAFLLSSQFFSSLSPETILVFITSLAISSSFFSFIPSIFLGSPDEGSSLSVLPGHELLLKGNGYHALTLALYGCILGILIIFLLTPAFIFLFPLIYSHLKPIMFLILISASFYLLFREKFLASLFIFLLSGFLGIATLNISIKNPLLPLLTGLFGSSSLITSIIKKHNIPNQKIENALPEKKQICSSLTASLLSMPLCAFLPALGSGQAAIIGSDLIEEKDRKTFLILLGAISAGISGLSFITLYALHESRTSSAVIIEKLIPQLSSANIFLILITIILSSSIAFILAIKAGKIIAKNIHKISYQKLSLAVLIFLSFVAILFSGFLGFLLFIVSTATGLSAILLNIRRTNLMGCLMLPAILLYLP